MRLLLLEDDVMLGSTLEHGLGLHGYSVEWMKNAKDAIASLESGKFDIAIFDLNLPDMKGTTAIAQLRAAKNITPILMLTVQDRIDEKIAALDAGADDFMTKPFDLNELLARLRAILRRNNGQTDNILRCKSFELNTSTQSVYIISTNETYTPSANELKLLLLLLQRPGMIISKDRIEEEVYGWNGGVGSNTVEVMIYNLRKKLGKDAIITLRGTGYMVAP